MDCQICTIYADNTAVKSNNCIIDCLEKIRVHYMDMLKKIDDNNLAMKSLKERNLELQEKIATYKRSSKEDPQLFSPECDGSDWSSDVMENEILNKTVDSLNVALNNEIDFETSYVNDSPNSYQKHKLIKREPMKHITSENVSIGDVSKKNKEFPEVKRESSSVFKENKFILPRDTSRRADKTLSDRPKLSLKSGLRQSRLHLGIKKKTFKNELSIDQQLLTPSLSMSDVSKSYHNGSRREGDSIDYDHTFELASPTKKNILPKETFLQQNDSETSSVMILTPGTEDIIFLDDSCYSNIESMDLLRDFVRPSNNGLPNLKLFESNRIKLLQKTASTKAMTTHNNAKEMDQSCSNSMLEETILNEPSASNELEDHHNKSSNSKENKKANSSRDERLLRLNCAECEKYIKYLGHRLSDEEIETYIRNCTKHKVNAEINCTPEGFWDPKIKPLDKDDPRMKVLVDTRFVRK